MKAASSSSSDLKVPPPRPVYALVAAILAATFVVLAVDLLTSTDEPTKVPVVFGAGLFVVVAGLGAVLRGAEERRRFVCEGRNKALDLIATYARVAAELEETQTHASTKLHRSNAADLKDKASRLKSELAEVERALWDAGACSEATAVADARRTAGLLPEDLPPRSVDDDEEDEEEEAQI